MAKEVQAILALLASNCIWLIKLARGEPFKAISKWNVGCRVVSKNPTGVSSHCWTLFSKGKNLSYIFLLGLRVTLFSFEVIFWILLSSNSKFNSINLLPLCGVWTIWVPCKSAPDISICWCPVSSKLNWSSLYIL